MIILLAGRIATGKTSVATELGVVLDAPVISVRHVLMELTGAPATRSELQRRGADLDRRTNGRWLLEYLLEHHSAGTVVVDAIRTQRQVEPVLSALSRARLAYLTAHDSTRRLRYRLAAHTDSIKQGTPFGTAENHPTERSVRDLEPMAHVLVETDDLSVTQVAREVVHLLDLVQEGEE